MSIIFAESFDPYGSINDMIPLWSSVPTFSVQSNTAFGVGQSGHLGTSAATATFTSATNETTIFGSIRVTQPAGTSAQYSALTFTDAGTAQCTIRWNSDGSIGLYTSGPTGTLLQTYSSIFAAGAWNSYQFKIVINNSTGSIEIRMNGGTSNVITKTGVNTRGGTANAFVNGFSTFSSGQLGNIDDVIVNNTSGNAPTSWPGDVRAIQQTPATTTSKNMDVFPTSASIVGGANQVGTSTCTNGNSYYGTFTASATGTIGSVVFVTNASATANMKFAIFDNTGSGGGPGTSLGTSGVIVNPVSGSNTATWSSPVSVTYGVTYWVGWSQDATVGIKNGNTGSFNTSIQSSTTAYASFPAGSPTISQFAANQPSITVTITNDNVMGVRELIEDSDTSYVYTSTVEEDKYSLTPIGTSYTVLAMQYFAMYKRSDVGSRTMQLSVAANGSADTSLFSDAAIPNTYTYKFKTIENDPTGASWTPTTVNGAIVGLSVTA